MVEQQTHNYVEAPYELVPDDPLHNGRRSVFLAGGITGCPDWQQEARALVHASDEDLIVVNPRRDNFPINDPNAAESQIGWEYYHLRLVDKILFWFPAATLCPIVLYELGAWSQTFKPIAVGVEPGYQREQDVRIQTRLVRPEVQVVSTIPDLVQEILNV